MVGIPVLCIGGLLSQSVDHLRRAVSQAGHGIGTGRGEIALLSCAFALGKVLEQALQAGGIGERIIALAPPPFIVIATVVVGGLVSSTLMEFIVRPALFWTYGRKAAERALQQRISKGDEFSEKAKETKSDAENFGL